MLGMGALHRLYEGAKRPGLSRTIMENEAGKLHVSVIGMKKDGNKKNIVFTISCISTDVVHVRISLSLYKNVCGNTYRNE